MPCLNNSCSLDKPVEVDPRQELPQVWRTLTALHLIALQCCIQCICFVPELSCQARNSFWIGCIGVTAAMIPLQLQRRQC